MNIEHTPGPWFAINDGTDEEPMMVVKAARIAGRPPKHCVAIVATGDSPQAMENANAHLIAAAPDLLSKTERLRAMSAAMAEDDGLWFVAETAAEAYLQQELRKLCAAIEGDPSPAGKEVPV